MGFSEDDRIRRKNRQSQEERIAALAVRMHEEAEKGFTETQIQKIAEATVEFVTGREYPPPSEKLLKRASELTDEKIVSMLMSAGETREDAEEAAKNRI